MPRMVNLDCFVHIGGPQLNGPLPYIPMTALAPTWTLFRNGARILRTVPCDAFGISNNIYSPWWDGSVFSGVGAWVPYNHVPGGVPGCKGGCWYANGQGIGSDCTYMQQLFELYPSAPGFAAYKQAIGGTSGQRGWTELLKVGAIGWTNIAAEWAKATAARADTLVAKWILLDGSDQDIRNWGGAAATYETDLRAVIAYARTLFNGADAKVLLVQPPPEFYQASQPGAAIAVRQIHVKIAGDTANVGLVESDPIDFVGGLAPGHVDPTGDKGFMSTEDYLTQGLVAFGQWRNMLAPPSSAATGAALPTILAFGDSIEVGPMQALLLALTGQAGLIGAPPGTVRAGQYVWNGTAQQIQLFNVLSNTNTLGTVNSFAGPVTTYTSELGAAFPDGCLVLHMGVNGSGLCDPVPAGNGSGLWRKSANQHYTTLLANWRAMQRAAMVQPFVNGQAWQGRTLDLLGVVANIGANDAYTAGNGANFLVELRQLVADMRADFGTRTTGKPMPFVCARYHKDGVLGSQAERTNVRDALRTLAAEDPRFGYVNMDDQELDRTDHIHDGVEGCLARGRRLVQKLLAIARDPGVPVAQPTADTVGSTVATGQQAIADAMALQPDVAAYTVNGRSVTRRSLLELIEADKYLEQKAARRAGLRQTLARFN